MYFIALKICIFSYYFFFDSSQSIFSSSIFLHRDKQTNTISCISFLIIQVVSFAFSIFFTTINRAKLSLIYLRRKTYRAF